MILFLLAKKTFCVKIVILVWFFHRPHVNCSWLLPYSFSGKLFVVTRTRWSPGGRLDCSRGIGNRFGAIVIQIAYRVNTCTVSNSAVLSLYTRCVVARHPFCCSVHYKEKGGGGNKINNLKKFLQHGPRPPSFESGINYNNGNADETRAIKYWRIMYLSNIVTMCSSL